MMVKVKDIHMYAMNEYGEVEVLFNTTNKLPQAHDTHWIRGWMGPAINLDSLDKRKISYPFQL
jgi:hypothetical protein